MAPILWLGTYERSYPRTAVLIRGLRELGEPVAERHEPVWEQEPHKAGDFLAPLPLARAAGRLAGAWARLAASVANGPRPRAVVAGYPAQPDAPFAWACARGRRVPLVVDMMISLVDTLGGDRGRASGASAAALAGLDRLTLRAASLAIADTDANAAFLARRFGVPRASLAVVPVGADPDLFAPRPPRPGPPLALFYGKLAPLHGLETVLEAVRRPGVPRVRLIGSGQLGAWLERELARDRPTGLEHAKWVPYGRLGDELAAASIALGVFGTSDKASRVVPNKVWQALAARRAVITADTPAAREVLSDGRDALLVTPGDPDALAVALRRLGEDPELRGRLAAAGRRRYEQLGTPRAVATRFRDALAEVAA